ncbi:MAG: sulfotransferase [Hyphomonadaceae bacterium]
MANDVEIEKFVQRFAAMRALAARAAREDPNDARALYGAAIAFRISGDSASALEQFERLCHIDPRQTHFRYELGLTQEYAGAFDAAIKNYAEALRLEPLNFRARHALAQLQKQSLVSNDIAELERQFAGPDDDGWRTLHLGHALAKTYEDIGDIAKSFDWLGRAKKRRRELHPYAHRVEATLAEAAMSVKLREGAACSDNDPIFVTGLPRSGTTLTDRILSSHPDVTSAGEIGNFLSLTKLMSESRTPASLDVDMIQRAGAIDYARLGRAYIDSTRPLTGAAPRFVDKAPSNFFLAPLILRALPNARIICVRRHPLDSVLSNYKQIFPFDDRYFDYVYDLVSVAEKFVIFDRVIAHWRNVLAPDRFMVLQYEDLVANQETATRSLLAFCGLAWNDRTLAFHENAASVSTPSARQVRQPMNAAAVGRWAKYGALLDPVRNVLERAGISLD